jgi:hypothetical protein
LDRLGFVLYSDRLPVCLSGDQGGAANWLNPLADFRKSDENSVKESTDASEEASVLFICVRYVSQS